MDRPFLLQLESLMARTVKLQPLTSYDLELLQQYYSSRNISSQMINMINQIWQLIQKLPITHFWNGFIYILTNISHLEAKIMGLTIFQHKMKEEWFWFRQQQKTMFSQFVLNNIDQLLFNNQNQATSKQKKILLRSINLCLVTILKKQKKTLFNDFISHFQADGVTLPYQKIINYFQILKLMISDDNFMQNCSYQQDQDDDFRQVLDGYMRKILKIICTFLDVDHQHKMQFIHICLQLFQIIVEYIPGYEIFNCNIISLLLSYINISQFHQNIFNCLKLIFNFQENMMISHDYHTKIAKKLLQILQHYFKKIQQIKKKNEWNDKTSQSTFDSRSIGQIQRNKLKNQYNNELLILLYIFLKRYTPYMAKKYQQNDLEVEYQKNIKIYFSQEFYNNFTSIYNRITNFLQIYIRQNVYFNLYNHSSQLLQPQCMILSCFRHIIILASKLKLNNHKQMLNLLQLFIVEMTPLPHLFTKYYAHLNLIQYQETIFQDNLTIFTEQYYQEYNSTLAVILHQNGLNTLYLNLMMKMIQSIDGLGLAFNVINRVSWSLVYAYDIDAEKITKQFTQNIMNIYLANTNKSIYKQLKRCFVINNKYIVLAYNPQIQIQMKIIFLTLNLTQDIIIQFTILILSKVLSNDKLMYKNFTLNDIILLLQKIKQIQQNDSYNQQLDKIYPAIYNVLIVIMDNVNLKDKIIDNSHLCLLYQNKNNNGNNNVNNNGNGNHYNQNVNNQNVMNLTVNYGNNKNYGSVIRDIQSKLIQKQKGLLNSFMVRNQITINAELLYSIQFLQKIRQLSNFLINKCKNIILITSTTLSKSSLKNLTTSKTFSLFLKWHQNHLFQLIQNFQKKNTIYFNHLKCLNNNQYYELKDILCFKSKYIEIIQSYIHLNDVKYKLDSLLKDNQHIYQKKREENEMNEKFIKQSIDYLKGEFYGQIVYKDTSFLKCLMTYHLHVLEIQPQNFRQFINHQLEDILSHLSQFQQIQNLPSQIVLAKYLYYGNLISCFLFDLSATNLQSILALIKSLRTKIYEIANYQAIFNILETLINELSKNVNENHHKSQIWNYYLQIFSTIFELFFDLTIKRNMFFRLSLIFLRCIMISKRIPFSLKNPKHYKTSNKHLPVHDNTEIIFMFLTDHIKKHITFHHNEEEQNNKYIDDILQEDNESLFIRLMRSYVGFIKRVNGKNKGQVIMNY